MSTIHFRYMDGMVERVACGASRNRPSSEDYSEVTCGRCARTDAYSDAAHEAQRTFTSEDVKRMIAGAREEVLAVIAEAGHTWASEAGHCSTYDEGIEEINASLLSRGLPPIPERVITWNIEIAYGTQTIDAPTEDEAWERIAEDPSTYLRLYRA